MKFGLKTIVHSLLFLLFLLCHQPDAGAQVPANPTDSFSRLFVKNRLSAQFVTGALFGPVSWMDDHATFNYAQTNLRFG